VQIVLTEAFQRDVERLSSAQREKLFSAILLLPKALREIHRHSGLGLRKIHSSGIYEIRVGLDVRVVFGFREGAALLHRVGTHDEVKRYLKNL
jgi:mRNA-degrading endonuclease RelE of RelBE toxin-antitoxin system